MHHQLDFPTALSEHYRRAADGERRARLLPTATRRPPRRLDRARFRRPADVAPAARPPAAGARQRRWTNSVTSSGGSVGSATAVTCSS